MRKSGRIIGAAFAMFAFLAIFPAAVYAGTGIPAEVGVRVYAEPDANGPALGRTEAGESFEVAGTETDAEDNIWYEIALEDGGTGYVQREDLLVAGDPEDLPGRLKIAEWQLVWTPNEEDAETLYLYNLAQGIRLVIVDEVLFAEDRLYDWTGTDPERLVWAPNEEEYQLTAVLANDGEYEVYLAKGDTWCRIENSWEEFPLQGKEAGAEQEDASQEQRLRQFLQKLFYGSRDTEERVVE